MTPPAMPRPHGLPALPPTPGETRAYWAAVERAALAMPELGSPAQRATKNTVRRRIDICCLARYGCPGDVAATHWQNRLAGRPHDARLARVWVLSALAILERE